MKKLLPLLILLLSSPAASQAASYYFSDCVGPGGNGSLGSPWCVIPTGQTTRKSVALLADGTNSGAANPEFAPGDTAYLCAGACDGAGSGLYNVAATASGTWFPPRASGTLASPITIRPYCSGAACETVTLSGDTDGNGAYTSGTDVASFMSNSLGSMNYYTIDGDPLRTGTEQHLIFEKTGGVMFEFANQNPGIRNWTWNGLEVRRNNPVMWNGGDLQTQCPANDQGSYVFHLDYMAGGPVTISNSKFHDICLVTIRANNNYTSGNDLLVLNNEWWNTGPVDDNNNFAGQNSGAKQTFRGNYCHDTSGCIFVGNNLQHVVIEDNVAACLGQYNVRDTIACGSGIFVNDGDSPQCTTNCWADDIIIRRNKIFGMASTIPPYGSAYNGGMNGGILWSANYNQGGATAFPTRAVIENNLVWWVHPRYDGIDVSSYTTFGKGGISVLTRTSGLIIQNNTVYASTYPFILSGAGGSPSFTIRNNLIIRAERPGGTHSPELWVDSNATGSRFDYNSIHTGGLSGNIISFGGAQSACGSIGSFNNGGLRQGNMCLPATFASVSGAKSAWDLRLAGTQAAVDGGCGGAGALHLCATTSGLATEDFEGQARFSGTSPDVGADEYGSPTTAPTASVSLSPTPPSGPSGLLLRQGTWTVTLSTSGQVVSLPSPLTLTDASGGQVVVALSGTVPGLTFAGTLSIGSNVADGAASFSLAVDALIDAQGNKGNTISSGKTLTVDRTSPQTPTGVVVQP